MKQIAATILLIVWLPLLAAAQDSDHSKGHGYFYVAPGVATEWENAPTLHFGGGGEVFFTKHVGVGAEAGYLEQFKDFRNLGTLSINLVARLRSETRDNKFDPFVTGGYTHFFRAGTPNGGNFGGGVNYWFSNHFGLRFEVRDNARGSRTLHHFVGFRIGLTFR